MAERVPGTGRSRATSAEAMTAGGMAVPVHARQPVGGGPQSSSLADILERVLDKGIVIAGDIRVNLLDIELLTIKIRLLVASVDKAREIGIDWWEHDPALSTRGRNLAEENRQLRERLRELEPRGTARRSVGDERRRTRGPEGGGDD